MGRYAVTHLIESLGNDKVTGRDLYLLGVPSLESLPERLTLATEHCVCLLASDASQLSTKLVFRAAEQLLAFGAVYICSWGPGCERVHDLFDEAVVGDGSGPSESPSIMTTWHETETLEEALWFALDAAAPADCFAKSCKSLVAISVASAEWSSIIRAAYTDPDALRRRVASDDGA